MLPEIHIGPLTLQTFGICFALAFIAAGAVVWRRLEELGKPVDWAYEMGFAALVGGLVGARLDFIIENYSDVKGDLLGNIFSGSGLVWYGGAIGGAIGVLLWAWWRGYLDAHPARHLRPRRSPSATRSAAAAARSPATATTARPGTGPGRWPIRTAPSRSTTTVHPTPVYETLAMGLVALLLWRLRDRLTNGLLFALYLLLAGTERFLVEFIRRNDDVALGLTQAQLISLAMMIAGGVWLALAIRGAARPHRLTAAARPSGAARRRAGSRAPVR